jgi:hypothetical protein
MLLDFRNDFYTLLIVGFIISTFFFYSCEKYQAEIPSYIHIDNISVTTNGSTQGSSSANITDAWVYLNGELLGVYELPATFPVIASGENTISIRAGIKVSGISANRAYYPFYTDYETNVYLLADSVVTISPQVTYQSWVEFPLIEEFNYSTSIATFELTSYSDTSFQTTTNSSEIFEGDGSAVIYLDEDHAFFECYTVDTYDLPQGGNPVYVEMNYKSEAEIYVGVVGIEGSIFVQVYPSIILNPSEDWNKIYINLTNEVSAEIFADEFKIYIAAKNIEPVANAKVYIDNFKIVH